MTVKPDPPPHVEVGRAGSGPAAASRLFQLFAAQTLPAGSIDTSVTIWMLPLWKMWITSPAFVPGGCPVVLSPANSAAERPHILPTPDVIIAIDVQAPRDAFGGAGEASRGGLGAIGTDHIDRTGDTRRRAFDVLNHMVSNELELLHDGYAFGKLRLGCAQIHVARHPNIFLRVQGKGANTDTGPEALHLGRIIGWEPDNHVRRGVGDPDTILRVDHDVEGRFQPCHFDNAAVLDPSAGKQQQLVVRAISNPDIAVWGDTNAHQSEEFFLEREIALGGDRLTAEIHYKDFPVKTADPDTVLCDGRAPADSVNAHAGEAGDRRGERGPVR